MEFDSNITVMIGANGTGKTTILEIIYNILSENFKYFLKYRNFTFINLEIMQDNKNIKISIKRENDDIQLKVNNKKVENLKEFINLEKIIYAPTEVNFINIESKGVSKIEGEEDKNIILDSDRMSKQLKQFLVNEKYKDLNDIAEGRIEKATRIENFKELYNNFFEDKEFIGINNNTFEPEFKIKDTNIILKIEDLSTGEKQIFFRGGSLLQNMEEKTIILLDEPEMSMHPEWQQKILDFYKNINPNSQYIISTHSAYIAVNTLPEKIRILEKNGDKVEVRDTNCAYGRTIQDVLTSVFDLDTVRNKKMDDEIEEYRNLYFSQEKNSEEQQKRFKELKEKITKYLDPNDPAISMLEFENGTKKLKEK
jgi:predicted ATP-binding protein involved in virulence